MAARRNPKIEAAHRERIQTSQLINRLNKIALGELQVDSVALKAIEIALSKTLPALQSVEMDVGQAQPFAVLPAVIEDQDTWTEAFDPTKAKH
jgi:hypothetical protein